MKLVPVNFNSIPLGKPMPFCLRSADGTLLANKGYVFTESEALQTLAANGNLFADQEESLTYRRAVVSQINTKSPLAALYHDDAVLEYMHCASTFHIIRQTECNILSGLLPAEVPYLCLLACLSVSLSSVKRTDQSCRGSFILLPVTCGGPMLILLTVVSFQQIRVCSLIKSSILGESQIIVANLVCSCPC